jgi:Dolichyl-phosphate-mannose-protein mannosyltransferase
LKKDLTPYYRLFALSLITILIAPSLIQDGMFMDGQQYACVAKNFSGGYGSWWFPYLSGSWWKADSGFFMEHPPLVYWLQGGFFKVLGTGMYTERIYSFLTALISAILIHKIWLQIFADRPEFKKISMLPVIAWAIVPVGFWSYQNNMQENTMAIFTLLAVYFFLVSQNPTKKTILWLIFSGLSISLAFLAKGPPALFPIVVVAAYYLAFKSISLGKTFFYSFVIVATILVFYSILLLNDAAFESLKFYVNERLLFRIDSEPVVTNRFLILIRLFMELLPTIGLVVAAMLYGYLMKFKTEGVFLFKRKFIFFIILGLAASLPLMLTSVQRGFYLVPSFPFFALALVMFAAPYFNSTCHDLSSKKKFPIIFKAFTILFFFTSVSITAMNYGESRRDVEILNDVHLIGQQLPERVTIATDPAIFDLWNLKFYFMRYYGITLTMDQSAEYSMTWIGSPCFENGEELNVAGTKLYHLCKK